jgi:hypothetical protein
VTDALAVYVRNHLAAARGGVDLSRRVAGNAEGKPTAAELGALADEIAVDLQTLLEIATVLDVDENKPFGLAARVGERIGRLKPNGAAIRRSPLTDVIEIEGLLDAVGAKLAAWDALLSGTDPRIGPVRSRLEDLRVRALDQQARLETLHRDAAVRVFAAR